MLTGCSTPSQPAATAPQAITCAVWSAGQVYTAGDKTLKVSGSGRYVRLYGTQRGTPYGYSLFEFKVYGAP